jgi:hypothetical protein
MTWVTPAPTSVSPGVPATKFGIAIGNGAKSPSGMITRFGPWAKARPPQPATMPSAAMPEISCRRFGRNDNSRN